MNKCFKDLGCTVILEDITNNYLTIQIYYKNYNLLVRLHLLTERYVSFTEACKSIFLLNSKYLSSICFKVSTVGC